MVNTAFIEELASGAPTPGGGGASAYCGALASSLASMVANLTVGKKRYAEVEDEMQAALVRLAGIRSRLVELVDADAEAFGPLAAAYRMPKETAEEQKAKEDAMQAALVGACEVPLSIMEVCMDVLHECEFLAYNGSRMALSDVGVAVAFGKAALQGASLNVLINVGSMKDEALAASYSKKMNEMISEGVRIADELYSYVVDQL